jgi:hypothetical protein
MEEHDISRTTARKTARTLHIPGAVEYWGKGLGVFIPRNSDSMYNQKVVEGTGFCCGEAGAKNDNEKATLVFSLRLAPQ